MTGIQTQWFLGIFFTVWSLSLDNGRISADVVKLVAGVILLVTAVLGLTLVR